MSLRVFWSDRLDVLADKMLDEWDNRPAGGNPFERTCIAVGDMATRNWLKDRFLLHRGHGRRRQKLTQNASIPTPNGKPYKAPRRRTGARSDTGMRSQGFCKSLINHGERAFKLIRLSA